MSNLPPKAQYVLRQKQDRNHTCHWPGCTKQVPPAMWGCRAHWYALPALLRVRIWRAFQCGQEKTHTPSREYVSAARDVQDWITTNFPETRDATLTDELKTALEDSTHKAQPIDQKKDDPK